MTRGDDISSDGGDEITVMDLPDIALDWFNFWIEFHIVGLRLAVYPLLLLTGLEAPAARFAPWGNGRWNVTDGNES
ncbi:MAG: hypothetical protein Q7T33_04820 [Dehalococcoidia bacterium]|nr:hypothetical protein [Dehalococcoidia bacterium]